MCLVLFLLKENLSFCSYADAVLKTFRTLYNTGSGLFGETCNVQSATCGGKFSVGGGSDSGYEYFAKMYVMSGKKVTGIAFVLCTLLIFVFAFQTTGARVFDDVASHCARLEAHVSKDESVGPLLFRGFLRRKFGAAHLGPFVSKKRKNATTLVDFFLF